MLGALLAHWVVSCLASAATAGHVVGGQGDWKFEYDPERLSLPGTAAMRNGHGVAKDSDGNIYFTFEPMSVDATTRSLVRFEPDGRGGVLLGSDNALSFGVPHGLRISYEDEGTFLYHANNAATVHKTDLEGNVVWTHNFTDAWLNTSFWPFNPTDATVPPGSDEVH